MTDNEDVLATLSASAGRRFLGIGSLWFMAVLIIYVAIASPPAFGWQMFLIFFGAASVYLAERLRRSTALSLELTRAELRDSAGNRIVALSDVKAVDRSVFAFKPSNGFLLTLTTKASSTWRPGLWWRLGRRIGIGGMTSGGQAKAMADIIAAMVLERDGKI